MLSSHNKVLFVIRFIETPFVPDGLHLVLADPDGSFSQQEIDRVAGQQAHDRKSRQADQKDDDEPLKQTDGKISAHIATTPYSLWHTPQM